MCNVFTKLISERTKPKNPRLFTVLHFSVRTSRSSALRDGLPSCMSVKTTQGAGAVWEEVRKIEGL